MSTVTVDHSAFITDHKLVFTNVPTGCTVALTAAGDFNPEMVDAPAETVLSCECTEVTPGTWEAVFEGVRDEAFQQADGTTLSFAIQGPGFTATKRVLVDAVLYQISQGS